jgi:hypothetical protein
MLGRRKKGKSLFLCLFYFLLGSYPTITSKEINEKVEEIRSNVEKKIKEGERRVKLEKYQQEQAV